VDASEDNLLWQDKNRKLKLMLHLLIQNLIHMIIHLQVHILQDIFTYLVRVLNELNELIMSNVDDEDFAEFE
jgi:hypothetical protein